MVKHISIQEWRRYHSKEIISPEELSNKAKEQCFVPHWTMGAIDVLHEGAEDYLITLMEDANLRAIHARCITIQPRDIQLVGGFVVTRTGTSCLTQHNFMGGSIILYFLKPIFYL